MTFENILQYCRNITAANTNRINATSNDTYTTANPELYDKDRHAILYIVVVLLFYSIGIIIGIITYLKREKAEIEEDKTYEDYMNFRSDPDKWARYFRVQRMIFHLNRVEREQKRKRRDILRQIVVHDDVEALEEGRRHKKHKKKTPLKLQRSNPEVGMQQQVEVVVESCHELAQCVAASYSRGHFVRVLFDSSIFIVNPKLGQERTLFSKRHQEHSRFTSTEGQTRTDLFLAIGSNIKADFMFRNTTGEVT
ncbi:hypothetical protein CAPTEDRAFT_207931 [Capitella teleta]|uniref:Uncharacterized protein n=1 Tax=Capitella teleta TaxID=283909 RepID=R7VGB8_CAPTE|nr:hypothetical protein CAPTEDRAFT_207931 [Capitella teleta]|eukprot:ELU17617.1 hypothetical protein CAPTEDRAFT_207931 [Capitella teleta]